MSRYSDVFHALAWVYLEDSWALALWPTETMLTFELEAVLTEAHPEYGAPAVGEQHDYRRARLMLRGTVSFTLSGAPPAVDASGERDLGSIDSWIVDGAGVSRLAGDWGHAQVPDAVVDFVLL